MVEHRRSALVRPGAAAAAVSDLAHALGPEIAIEIAIEKHALHALVVGESTFLRVGRAGDASIEGAGRLLASAAAGVHWEECFVRRVRWLFLEGRGR